MPDRSQNMSASELLQRLTLYAYGLWGCVPQLTMEPALRVSGKSPEDLAMDVLVRYFDARDTTVAWDAGRGDLLGYLKTVLWHDFVDLKRAALYRNTTAAPDSFDGFAGPAESPEARAARAEQREALLRQLADAPELQALVALQLDLDGWPGYSNQELAQRLQTSVADVENRKKRLLRRLLAIWREQQAVAAGHEQVQ
ncbi:MAG: RNA polymerase sigma factor [Terriglobales bacterium]